MPSYKISYYRHDKRIIESKEKVAQDMDTAVESAVIHARKYLVKLSDISVSLTSEDKGGVQRYCDTCLIKPASHGVKNKIYCKECKSD